MWIGGGGRGIPGSRIWWFWRRRICRGCVGQIIFILSPN